MRNTFMLFAVTTTLLLSGCKTFTSLTADPSSCEMIKDGSFAVGTFGCMKIQDLPSRDLCTKAALAGSLLARQACLTHLVKTGSSAEIGDPPDPRDREVLQDARAILQEWESLESPSHVTQPTAPTP